MTRAQRRGPIALRCPPTRARVRADRRSAGLRALRRRRAPTRSTTRSRGSSPTSFPTPRRRSANSPPKRRRRRAAILEALGDNRLLIDPADARRRLPHGGRQGPRREDRRGDRRRRRVQEGAGQQRAAQRDRGRARARSTLANPDPEKRLAAAEDVFKTRDAKALPALKAQLAKESDPRVADALKLARRRDRRDERRRDVRRPALGDRDAEGARRPGRART